MKRDLSAWQFSIVLGAFAYAYGVLFAPEWDLWGEAFYVWPTRAGLILSVIGLGTWLVLADTGRLHEEKLKRSTHVLQIVFSLGSLLNLSIMFLLPRFMPFDERLYEWQQSLGALLFFGGLVAWSVLPSAGKRSEANSTRTRFGPASSTNGTRRRDYESDDDHTDRMLACAGAIGLGAGMMFNVNGTPMIEGTMMDVTGHSYGDSGDTFSSDIGGSDMFGNDIGSSDMSSSSDMSGSDW